MGTGTIFSPNGYILTNYHVIAGNGMSLVSTPTPTPLPTPTQAPTPTMLPASTPFGEDQAISRLRRFFIMKLVHEVDRQRGVSSESEIESTKEMGMFWFARMGWLDYELIFLPPTYIWPQAIGGMIFGAGFVTGGLCPGTSCVAISSGRIDGLAMLFGLFAGILLFNEFFEYFADFYRSGSLGPIALPDYLGVPHTSMLVGVVVLALAAFAGSKALEKRRGGS